MTNQQIEDLMQYIKLVSERAVRGSGQPMARQAIEEILEIEERLRASAEEETDEDTRPTAPAEPGSAARADAVLRGIGLGLRPADPVTEACRLPHGWSCVKVTDDVLRIASDKNGPGITTVSRHSLSHDQRVLYALVYALQANDTTKGKA